MIYDNEETLKNKGWQEIDEIRNWWLEGRVVLPDLNKEKRVGITKNLTVFIPTNQKERFNSGKVLDSLIFLTPRSTPVSHQNFSEIF